MTTVRNLTRQESLGLLDRGGLARLGCTRGPQPYVVPINYVLEDTSLYAFSTYGRKIEWMRNNPLVCIQADEVSSAQSWKSVIATGRYEELTSEQDIEHAWSLLQARPSWWQPGFVKTVITGVERPLVPVYYRIHLDEISGHAFGGEPAPATERSGSFRRLFAGLAGRNAAPTQA